MFAIYRYDVPETIIRHGPPLFSLLINTAVTDSEEAGWTVSLFFGAAVKDMEVCSFVEAVTKEIQGV
jgi:hypothetical protein